MSNENNNIHSDYRTVHCDQSAYTSEETVLNITFPSIPCHLLPVSFYYLGADLPMPPPVQLAVAVGLGVEVGIAEGRHDAIHAHYGHAVVLHLYPFAAIPAILATDAAVHALPVARPVSLQRL